MSASSIDVQLACEATDLPAAGELERYVLAALPERRRDAALTLRVVDAEEGAELNERFRGRDGPTNVLSFPFEAPPGMPAEQAQLLLGDVVLCAPVARTQAREQAKSLAAHVAHLVVHGVLHLLGFDHLDDAQAQRMEGAEVDVLAELGFADPYLPIPGPASGHR